MKRINPLILFVLLFLSLRIIMLLMEPAWLGFCEAFRATAAHDLITERKFALFDYAFRHNEGGSLFVALIAAVFFKIFRESIFSLHLVPLTFSLASLILGYSLLKKYSNILAANIFAAVFIFAPQTYIRLSLLIFGNHAESILFTFIILFCLGKIFLGKELGFEQEARYLSLLGFVCGFSIWFAYINLIALLSCFVCLFFFDRSLFKRKSFLFFPVFFILGISPLIIYNLTYAYGGTGFVLNKPLYSHFFNNNFQGVLSKAYTFFIYDLPQSLFYTSVWIFSRNILAYSFYLISISILILFIFAKIKSNPAGKKDYFEKKQFLNIFVLIYLIIFLLIYLLSDFKVDPRNVEQGKGYRYVIALFPLFLIIFSQAFSFLVRKRYVSIKFIYALIFINFLGLGHFIDYRNFLKSTMVLPISYQSFGFSIADKFDNDLEKCSVYSEKVPLNLRNFYFWGIGEKVAMRYIDNPGRFSRGFQAIPEEYRPSFYLGFGNDIAREVSDNIEKIMNLANSLDDKYRKYVYTGIGLVTALERFENVKIFSEHINDEYLCFFYEGIGAAVFYSSNYDLVKCNDILTNNAKIKEQYRKCCFRGISFIFVEESLPNPKSFYDTLKFSVDKITKKYQNDFSEGLKEKRLLLEGTF